MELMSVKTADGVDYFINPLSIVYVKANGATAVIKTMDGSQLLVKESAESVIAKWKTLMKDK